MQLLDFPTELLEAIAHHLQSQADINSLLQTNRRLYCILNPHLYTFNARSCNARFSSSALSWAAEHHQLRTAKHSLRHGMTALLDWDRDPLHIATSNGDEDMVMLLLQHDAGVDCRKLRQTPLYVAATRNHEGVARLLLQNGADIESNNFEGNLYRYNTPLHIASYFGHVAMMKLLLERGANIEAENSNGNTPLIQALRGSQPTAFQLLVDSHARLTRAGESHSILHEAALEGNVGIVRVLLDRGLDPNSRDRTGRTPLVSAALQSCYGVVKLLVERKVDLEMKDHQGLTALSTCAFFGLIIPLEILLDCGADPNTSDVHGDTPLHKAVTHDQDIITRALVENGANLEAKNGSGETPLFHAVREQTEANVRFLLQQGADRTTKSDDGTTLLYLAAQFNNKVILGLLQ
ncbi:uncharacterized protein N7482_005592 [Penicillium canariense]|uniref:Ankyrin repeat-containing domain protein n=1 Tax=Penicillium canariense TaxID=189055 RepID=A0A9W9LN60_9EURO|nr:uncharacterized protein N7482_005592 [Penicillium canariense]KAJ5166811.1 hypothetical protein N7482_005592 [Penicillium canariense]